jgi:hypothetical protein
LCCNVASLPRKENPDFNNWVDSGIRDSVVCDSNVFDSVVLVPGPELPRAGPELTRLLKML